MNDLTHLSHQPPQRQFRAGGPMPREGAYTIRNRPEIRKIMEQVETGRYFVIYAPRQVGKTSLIQEVVEKLERMKPIWLYIFRFRVWATIWRKSSFIFISREDCYVK